MPPDNVNTSSSAAASLSVSVLPFLIQPSAPDTLDALLWEFYHPQKGDSKAGLLLAVLGCGLSSWLTFAASRTPGGTPSEAMLYNTASQTSDTQWAFLLTSGCLGCFAFISLILLLIETAFGSTLGLIRHHRTVRRIAHHDDPRILEPMIETLSDHNRVCRNEAAQALTRILPRMTADATADLPARYRALLHPALHTDNTPLVVVILRAFTRFGGSADLSAVEPLTRSRNQAIQEAALQCRAAILKRRENERAAQTLLRPGCALDVSPETLVRPAAFTPETERQQLLRSLPQD